ncbi:hypothetical protein [Hymenobacter bucti]|uniref:Uncharacterized protein n=1 Tax=Hymenobacter bucti TaxID=1844114 RepID=A0ABW4QR56_9BACT
MKTLFFALAASLVAGAPSALAQYQPGVYTSSQEYVQNSPAKPGTVTNPVAAHPYLEVVHASTYAVHRVPLTHAWGYANMQGQTFRVVDNKQYRLQPQQNGLVIYNRQRPVQNGRYTQVITEHFYSEGLDGKIHSLTKRALRQQLAVAQ